MLGDQKNKTPVESRVSRNSHVVCRNSHVVVCVCVSVCLIGFLERLDMQVRRNHSVMACSLQQKQNSFFILGILFGSDYERVLILNE